MSELVVDDPYTGGEAARVPYLRGDDVDAALERARTSAREIAALPVAERVALCLRAVEAMEREVEPIAQEISRQMGKPVTQARGEMGGMAGRARHMCSIAPASLADIVLPEQPGLERRIVRTPKGVVYCLPAWNYPLLTAVNVVIPAVLSGNSVVLEHSHRSPLVGDRFAAAFAEAGGPSCVVQSIQCDHATSEKIVGDVRVDHVAYTGSVFGGQRMSQAAAGRFIDLGLELGGNDPAYVAADADLAKAIDGIVDGACYNAGQSCCAVERVYVHESLYDAFIEGSLALLQQYVMGDPRDEKTNLGPIAQPQHVGVLLAQVEDAVRRGARLLLGGTPCSVEGRGRFFPPTLLVDVPEDAEVMSFESFGPLLPITKVTGDEDALRRMNDDALGLTASVWTNDRERVARLAPQLEFGTVYMNRCDALDPGLPWTGVKASGKGSTLSALGFEHLTRPKSWNFRV